jgi:hypothetical protein
MIDAVLSYHMNPATCGVAKFNHALAKRLGVPLAGVYGDSRKYWRPLLSIKPGEIGGYDLPYPNGQYSLFLHSFDSRVIGLASHARRVFAANAEIADLVRPYRDDVITAHCPSTVEGDASRGSYRVLTFGMAHKLVLPHFVNLKRELERDHPDYTLSLSTAVHEGSPWDEALTSSTEAMRDIFGDRLRVLGFLADDALAKEIRDCDAVAAFFVPALRANNTSAWAALAAGKFLYTNLDAQSPALDPEAYGWDALLKVLA